MPTHFAGIAGGPLPMSSAALRKIIGIAGVTFLGGALAYAPVAAFHDDMVTVTKAGLVGIVLIVVAWLIPREPLAPEEPPPGDHR